MEGNLVTTNAGKPDNEMGAPDLLFATEESLSGLQSITLHSHTTACDRRWALLLSNGWDLFWYQGKKKNPILAVRLHGLFLALLYVP